MKKETTAYVLLFLSFAACRNEDDSHRFNVLSESMVQYDKTIEGKTLLVRYQLAEKANDPQTAARAAIWKPRVDSLKQIADSMRAYIDYLQASLAGVPGATGDSGRMREQAENSGTVENLFKKQGNADILYRRLDIFKKKALALFNPDDYYKDNPAVLKDLEKAKEQFGNSYPLSLIRPGEPVAGGTISNPIAGYFENTGIAGALSMLHKLHNDISITENLITDYFNSQAPYPYYGYYFYHPLATINSSHLKTGQPVEVTAGIGAYSTRSNPAITINGKAIPINADGMAVYNTIARGRPGKHFIPITITYYRPDGVKATVFKNIEYIIAE
jgi:hypothetical protein